MSKCLKCGAEIDNAAFCPYCGMQQTQQDDHQDNGQQLCSSAAQQESNNLNDITGHEKPEKKSIISSSLGLFIMIAVIRYFGILSAFIVIIGILVGRLVEKILLKHYPEKSWPKIAAFASGILAAFLSFLIIGEVLIFTGWGSMQLKSEETSSGQQQEEAVPPGFTEPYRYCSFYYIDENGEENLLEYFVQNKYGLVLSSESYEIGEDEAAFRINYNYTDFNEEGKPQRADALYYTPENEFIGKKYDLMRYDGNITQKESYDFDGVLTLIGLAESDKNGNKVKDRTYYKENNTRVSERTWENNYENGLLTESIITRRIYEYDHEYDLDNITIDDYKKELPFEYLDSVNSDCKMVYEYVETSMSD